jgi:EAL domain-containing protein (putative c-di-GMP-specific phosphodiesterase class I)/CheY-like chemotaxis protein
VRRVLVVDDDNFMLRVLTRTLESLGCGAIAACSGGAEALSRLRGDAEWPDVVLCDLNMPEMDGVEFLRKLAEIRYAGAIVIISGADKRVVGTVETVARGHQLQILGHLEKPVTPEQLKAMLARWQPRRESKSPDAMQACTADEIRVGLAEGQFIPWFQPEVEVVTGFAVAAESFARWRHPTRGMIAPNCFLPVAEKSGLMRELTASVITQSLRQAQEWRRQGIDMRIAINVSVDDLVRLDFPEHLLGLAEAAGVKPFNVTLEVTERRLSANAIVSLDILARLHLKRIGLSIGDFGAGQSALSWLKDFPFEELKLGQSFVRGAVDDMAARDILESAIGIGKKFSMRVVAEGVENQAQWDLVTGLGVDIVQGHFIAEPMPGHEVAEWIKAWNSR